jgi:hypothetical protein
VSSVRFRLSPPPFAPHGSESPCAVKQCRCFSRPAPKHVFLRRKRLSGMSLECARRCVTLRLYGVRKIGRQARPRRVSIASAIYRTHDRPARSTVFLSHIPLTLHREKREYPCSREAAMAEGINVVCANCGREFVVSEDLAGHSTTCPQCERQVAVPFPSTVRDERPRLQVRRGTPIAGGKACPGCGAAMAADAVICVQCGFDTRTGVSWQTKPAGHNLMKPILAIAGAVIIVGWLHLWLKSRRESGPIGEPPPVATPSASAVSPPPVLEQTEPSATSASSKAEVVVAAPPSNATPPETTANVPETASAPRMSRDELERQLTQTLDARYPLYTRGAQAVLRQNNGRVHRGEIIVLATNSVTLKTELGIQEIEFALLDKESRLRCDAAARKRLIQTRIEQMLSASSP